MNKHNWTYKKLGEVCDFQGGSQPPKEEWSKEQKPNYVRMLQIRDFTQSSTEYIEYVKESKSLKYCKDDDVLIGRYGASVGKILTGLSGAYNVAIIKSIPNETIVKKDYIKAYFSSPWFQQNLLIVSQHRAAQAGFSKEDISEFPIPVPPLSTQSRIVSELDLLQSLIDKQKAQLKEYDTLAQSIFYDMFGDPVENEKGWEVKKLGEITNKISDGVHAKPNYTETGMPFISVVNINRGKLIFDDCKYVSQTDGETFNKRTKPEKGDILYTKVGATYGISALVDVDIDFCLYVSVCLIKPKRELLDSLFLTHMMRLPYIKNQADERIRGIGVPDLHLNQISAFDVIVPPLSLQQSFATKIEAIEKQKSAISKSIAETEKLFDYTMDKYFG